MKLRPTYEVKLYLGSVNEETKKSFTKEELIELIATFQDGQTIPIPVCVSDTEFVSGSNYREKGWMVSVINYPRRKHDIEMLEEFMQNLAFVLLSAFKQDRITVVGPHRTVMLER